MFLLLTQVLLWLLVGGIIWYILTRFIPKAYFTWLGGLIIFIFIVLAFFQPTNRTVADVWSILSIPLKPLGLAVLLLLGALGNIKKGGITAAGRNQVWAALMILLLSSVPAVSYWLTQQSEQAVIRAGELRREICVDQCPVAPVPTTPRAIVVLGQGTTQASLPYRPQIQLTDTGNRILYAAEVYRTQVDRGNAPVIIVSAGPRLDLQGNSRDIVEANDIVTVLTSLGVPRQDIIVEQTGVDVQTSAQAIRNILRDQGLGDRIILVTSALEARRATLTFENLGIRVAPRPTNFFTIQEGATPARRIRVADFIPSADALLRTTRVVEEYLTSIYYFLRGWLTPSGF